MAQPGNFDSLPFPMQVMMFRQMQQEQQQRQQAQQARGQAGQALYNQFGGQPQPQGMPPPPPMSAQMGKAPAPQPGTLSPGGGNPMAQGGASVMAPQPQPQPGGMPMGMVPPPPGAQPGGMPMGQPAPQPQQIPPFQPMPSAPQQAPGMAGEVPPPPMGAGAAGAVANEPRPLDLKSIVMGLKGSGVPADQVMNVLDTLAPTMNAQNKQEVAAIKAETAAQAAAANAYKAELLAWKAGEELNLKHIAEDRKREGMEGRARENQQKIALMKARLEAAVGGAGNLKTVEYVYPKGADGRPDTTQAPIGTRGTTKTGKIINLDAEGHQVPTQAGATVKDSKAANVNVRDTVRTNLVLGAANNALDRLNEIEKKYPNDNASLLLQVHGEGFVEAGAESLYRRAQSDRQLAVDQAWRNLITEAIPVLTGGLRGSDSFRRFLIQESPLSGTGPGARTEGRRMLRANIEGMKAIFEGKPAPAGFDSSFVSRMLSAYAADPKMWASGVTAQQVEQTNQGIQALLQGSGSAAAPKPAAAPKAPTAGTVQDGYRFKGGDPSKRENWERVQ